MSENAMRCAMCRKKVGALGFECKCGNVFCVRHRILEDHACPTLQTVCAEKIRIVPIVHPKVVRF
jgi:predicted nucleic acid binding AN1-type Zn finger protein